MSSINRTVTVTEPLRVWRFSYTLECPPITQSGWVNVLARSGEEAHGKFREQIRVGTLELGEPVPVLDLNVNCLELGEPVPVLDLNVN